ncbi:MAG: hypothetical protein AMJ68_03740 [Acidithiobacillales bacterium SG8_45]|jgi:hypothetical protein|nr:MAG: hypothetical protein AMJ68_03740 [Acidithiobacillales bacterium SG8_45]
MIEVEKKTIQLFLLFSVAHTALFIILPFTFAEFNDRVNWFAINAIPWWPLYKLNLPVTRQGWLMMPNVAGWIWCAVVWIAFYYFVARGTVVLLGRRDQ